MRPRRLPLPVLAAVMTSSAVLASCGGADDREVVLPDCLDLPALYALVGPESIGLRQWDDAEPLARELGSETTDGLPAEAISIFGPGEESGTFDSFTELAIEGLAEQRGIPDDEALPRPDYVSSPNDNVIVDGVAGTPGSFGWLGHAYLDANSAQVRPFEIVGPDGRCVAPTDRSIASGRYPLARDLYVYVNRGAAEDNAALAAFVDRLLGPSGREAVTRAGYVALDDATWEQTTVTWTEAAGSSEDRPPESGLSGSIVVSGSSTVEPISSLVAEDFSADHPGVSISVDGPGTGDGFEQFCDGETDVSNASRSIEDEERAACQEAGVEVVELKVAIDGLSVVTRA